MKWAFTTGGDVSATPAVDGSNVYVPDWAGNLYAVDRSTGAQVWSASIAAATGVPGDKARATPVLSGDKVIVGTQGPFGGPAARCSPSTRTRARCSGARPARQPLRRRSSRSRPPSTATASTWASPRWRRRWRRSSPATRAAASAAACSPSTSNTGAIVWKTYMAPPGYSGNAIWGSSPAIDTKRGQVYIATGNNYSVPQDVLDCVAAAGNDPAAIKACIAADNYFDSIMALDLKTGAIRWATAALPFDAWTVDCIPFLGDGSNCPEPAGPDYDFGQAPALFTVKPAGNGQAARPGRRRPEERPVLGARPRHRRRRLGDAGRSRRDRRRPAVGLGGRRPARLHGQRQQQPRSPGPCPAGATTGVWSGLDAVTGAAAVADDDRRTAAARPAR